MYDVCWQSLPDSHLCISTVASVIETALPSVIPLYVSWDGVERCAGAFAELELEALMARAMIARGVYPASPTLEGIFPALRGAGRRFLFIVDEIDAAYKVRHGTPAYHNVLSSLGTLDALGNDHSGLVSVVLCGSSSVTGQLIRGDPAHIADRFPLMADGGTVDLNSQKYPSRRLPWTICANLAPVKRMVQSMLTAAGADALPDDDLLRLARIVAFSAGVTPRAVTTFIAEGVAEGVVNTAFVAVSPKLSFPAAALHEIMMRRLAEANHALRALLLDSEDGALHVDRVMQVPWENALRPLSWSEVREAWAEVRAGANVSGETVTSPCTPYLYVEPVLWELCDAGLYAAVDETTQAVAEGIALWPCVPIQVLLATPGVGPERGWKNRAYESVKKAMGAAATAIVVKTAETGLA